MRLLMASLAVGGFLFSLGSTNTAAEPGSWPQFRGPHGAGIAEGNQPLPDRIGPTENVIWKRSVPPGHSSPVLVGDRIYLTAVRDKDLVTMALDRRTGESVWETTAPHKQLEEVHNVGNQAQSTPTADAECVVSFFGSCGLFCYSRDGKAMWHVPMGPFKNDFGAGSSPIIVGGRVILNQDHDIDSALMCFDKQSGKPLWKVDRSEFPRGYSSPAIWNVAGRQQVVIAGTLRVVGYDLETGRELWTVRGISRVVNMTPVVGPDGTLYVAGWAGGADSDDLIRLEPFDAFIAANDANKNGKIEADEVPKGPLTPRFPQIDRDKDQHITREEYEGMQVIFERAHNVLLAIKPGGEGDITATHVLWRHEKHLPYIPSPLVYEGRLYLVKDGGILSSLDAQTGKPMKQSRIFGNVDYFSSPVAGDGKVYLVSESGEVNILRAQSQWETISTAKLDEEVYATPALVDGRIYLRTRGHLYCFGLKAP
jgi:outer membrane protein assembly factor BamB